LTYTNPFYFNHNLFKIIFINFSEFVKYNIGLILIPFKTREYLKPHLLFNSNLFETDEELHFFIKVVIKIHDTIKKIMNFLHNKGKSNIEIISLLRIKVKSLLSLQEYKSWEDITKDFLNIIEEKEIEKIEKEKIEEKEIKKEIKKRRI